MGAGVTGIPGPELIIVPVSTWKNELVFDEIVSLHLQQQIYW
jgi:hypothetical protein